MQIETPKQNKSAWTLVSESKEKIQAKPLSSSKFQFSKTQKSTFAVYFTAFFFLIWFFLYREQFSNLSADLFVASTTSTGEILTGTEALTTEESQTENIAQPLLLETEIINEAQEIEINPLHQVETQVEQWDENIFVETELPAENLHKAEALESVEPVNLVVPQTEFKINTHTYDKVGVKEPLIIKEAVETEEIMHNAAATSSLVQPKQTPQSGPAENLIFIIAFVLSGIAWFGLRKLKA